MAAKASSHQHIFINLLHQLSENQHTQTFVCIFIDSKQTWLWTLFSLYCNISCCLLVSCAQCGSIIILACSTTFQHKCITNNAHQQDASPANPGLQFITSSSLYTSRSNCSAFYYKFGRQTYQIKMVSRMQEQVNKNLPKE